MQQGPQAVTTCPLHWCLTPTLHCFQVTLFPSSYTRKVELFVSNSYPALRTQYTCHRVAGEVAGLPAGPFQTREPRPGGELVSSWVWEDRDAVLEGCGNKSIG